MRLTEIYKIQMHWIKKSVHAIIMDSKNQLIRYANFILGGASGGEMAVTHYISLKYLNKDEVPYLNACRIVIIDQRCSISVTNSVKMYFSARSARTSVTHLPEIVLSKGKHLIRYANSVQKQFTI
jgi:hypothetical protein